MSREDYGGLLEERRQWLATEKGRGPVFVRRVEAGWSAAERRFFREFREAAHEQSEEVSRAVQGGENGSAEGGGKQSEASGRVAEQGNLGIRDFRVLESKERDGQSRARR